MIRIFYIDWQQHWKYDRTMNIGANTHGKRAVSTLKIATSDRLDLRWQLGFLWHGIGIELVLQVPRLFHNATVSQCNHFLLLHMYMYLLFETSSGWRGFFLTQFGGGHSAPMYLLFVPYTDAAESISAFQTSFLLKIIKGILTHCGLVTPYGDRDLGQHCLR